MCEVVEIIQCKHQMCSFVLTNYIVMEQMSIFVFLSAKLTDCSLINQA